MLNTITALLAYVGPLLLIALKVGVVIGGTGSLLEELGKWRKWPKFVAFGQKLEAIGSDIPKLVGKIEKLLPPGSGGPAARVERISFQRPPSDPNIAAITSLHRRRSAWRWLRVSFESYRHRAPRWVPTYVLLLLAALLIGCGSHISWPAQVQCAEQLEQPLVQAVASVLAGTGDVKTELEQIALTKGAGVVECAVQQLINDLASGPTTARASRAAARGREFLASVQQ